MGMELVATLVDHIHHVPRNSLTTPSPPLPRPRAAKLSKKNSVHEFHSSRGEHTHDQHISMSTGNETCLEMGLGFSF